LHAPWRCLLLVDRGAQVTLRCAPDGRTLLEVGNRDKPSDTGYTEENPTVLRAAGPFNVPTDVAMSASGDFYVSDGYRNARVHKFSADGRLLLSWGEPGTGPGQFNLPHSVWEAKGRVYVADRQNDRIQVFTPEGQFLDMWTGFARPTKIFVDENDIMYLAELSGRVSILGIDGRILLQIGSPDDRDRVPGKFISPHGIWADSHGDFYVTETTTGQRVQKFARKRG